MRICSYIHITHAYVRNILYRHKLKSVHKIVHSRSPLRYVLTFTYHVMLRIWHLTSREKKNIYINKMSTHIVLFFPQASWQASASCPHPLPSSWHSPYLFQCFDVLGRGWWCPHPHLSSSDSPYWYHVCWWRDRRVLKALFEKI